MFCHPQRHAGVKESLQIFISFFFLLGFILFRSICLLYWSCASIAIVCFFSVCDWCLFVAELVLWAFVGMSIWWIANSHNMQYQVFHCFSTFAMTAIFPECFSRRRNSREKLIKKIPFTKTFGPFIPYSVLRFSKKKKRTHNECEQMYRETSIIEKFDHDPNNKIIL